MMSLVFVASHIFTNSVSYTSPAARIDLISSPVTIRDRATLKSNRQASGRVTTHRTEYEIFPRGARSEGRSRVIARRSRLNQRRMEPQGSSSPTRLHE